ncbi:unnamed protein product [Protopolystoma xenopodis]|uniref:Dynein heavy chain tail domain-containing protein n=1 Tax=Protopolystoma xenopodis TaxID=117903 RepID=A0A448WP72_9PLAT|nr:unnamed protein product [Protopolystoma xenopodis]
MCDTLKEGLIQECVTWRHEFGKAVNQRCAREMDEVLEFFDNMMKRLSRPIKDLDDVRMHMAALAELREAEIRLDLMIGPIEEAYAMLGRYELYFNDGNAERVDALAYGYSKLRSQARQVQDHLLGIQPQFEGELIGGVRDFLAQVDTFAKDYFAK